MEIIELFEGFKNHLKVGGYAERTIKEYGYCLKVYDHFLTVEGIEKVTGITKQVQIKFQNYLFFKHKTKKGKTLTASSQELFITAIKTFFQYLIKHEKVLVDTAIHLTTPKRKKKEHKDILTKKEVVKLVESFDIKDAVGYRDFAIIHFLLCTGMRASELCNIKLSDLDLVNRTVLIEEGKGGDSRYGVLTKNCQKILMKYITQYRGKLLLEGEKEWLFLSYRGKKLQRANLTRMITSRADQAGIKHISPHSIRRTVATLLVSNEKTNVYYAQQLLGHKSIATTERYLGKSKLTKLRQVLEENHPLKEVD